MPIALAAPITPPQITGYDIDGVSFDFTQIPRMVTIAYHQIGGPNVGSVTMTLAQFDAVAGAGMRLRALNALAGANGLNLAGASVT